ncbi:MAG: transcription termination/antitermination factor NusG [Bacteroidetes bacterium]|nr:MAG: transcription termination/antitermination factor NusG [Bacteroidota bacterium]
MEQIESTQPEESDVEIAVEDAIENAVETEADESVSVDEETVADAVIAETEVAGQAEITEIEVSESGITAEASKETVPDESKPIIDSSRPDAKWYAIRTYTGHESKVKMSIEAEVKRLKLQERIFDVIIPQETVFEVRGGKRRTKIKNFLPGYIIMKAVMDKKIIEIITNVPSVVSFVGSKIHPTPLQPHEIERIIGRVEERRSIATIVTSFETGDPVKVIDGPFTNFNGTVKEVNHEKQKLKVEVGILGRKTPVELDFSQVELENH